MIFSQKLAQLRRAQRLSQVQVAAFLTSHGREVTQRAVSKWERGDTMPDAEQLLILCELYDVRDVLTEFRGAREQYAALNALGKQRLAEYAAMLGKNSEFIDKPATIYKARARLIPLHDLPASAGTGQFLDSDSYELIEADETVPPSATLAIRIVGDSMIPRYVDGQIVYVRQQRNLNYGDCGVFILNGDAYCKRLISLENGVALESINPQYPPLPITEFDELKIVGKVVG